MYLGKFLAVAGVASRRKSVDLIKAGSVQVNGVICTNPAQEITSADQVLVDNTLVVVMPERRMLIMLNKPRGVICAVDDGGQNEITVIDLIAPTFPDLRLYPVGRLDKDTTGLLLITNDGDLAYQLMHPKFEVEKKYQVTLDHVLGERDKKLLLDGLQLSDGITKFDSIIYDQHDRRTVIVTLHSGKNRIIRRMFGEVGYTISALHRLQVGTYILPTDLLVGEYIVLDDDV